MIILRHCDRQNIGGAQAMPDPFRHERYPVCAVKKGGLLTWIRVAGAVLVGLLVVLIF